MYSQCWKIILETLWIFLGREKRGTMELTPKVEVGRDDEKIREDDGDADHEYEARLHKSLQRGLLHAASRSRCIPPPALKCVYPSPCLRDPQTDPIWPFISSSDCSVSPQHPFTPHQSSLILSYCPLQDFSPRKSLLNLRSTCL